MNSLSELFIEALKITTGIVLTALEAIVQFFVIVLAAALPLFVVIVLFVILPIAIYTTISDRRER